MCPLTNEVSEINEKHLLASRLTIHVKMGMQRCFLGQDTVYVSIDGYVQGKQVEQEFNVKRYMAFIRLVLGVMNLVTNSSTIAVVPCQYV